jgi:hypothetical protein
MIYARDNRAPHARARIYPVTPPQLSCTGPLADAPCWQGNDGKIPVTEHEQLTWIATPDPSIRGLKSVGTVNGQAAYYTSSGALYFKSPAGQWAELTDAALPGNNAASGCR